MAWVDDTFTDNNGSAPNLDKWTEIDADNKLSIQNNKLDFNSEESAGAEARVNSNYTISGDFSIQVDIEELYGVNPATSNHNARLQINSADFAYLWISIIRDDTNGKQFYVNGETTSSTYITRSLDITKLKLERSGSVIKGYYWSGSQWEWNGSTDGFTFSETSSADISVILICQQRPASQWHAAFDNFVVNAGSITPELLFEDFTLDLAAYHQKYDAMQMILQAHDGLEFRDFALILEAIKEEEEEPEEPEEVEDLDDMANIGVFQLDCASTYYGPPVTEISGLDYLEGEAVMYLADCVRVGTAIVTGGQISLDAEATYVIVGLPYVTIVKTLTPDAGALDGPALGRKNRITNPIISFYRSGNGIKFGPDFDRLKDVPELNDNSLTTVNVPVTMPGGFDTNAQIIIMTDRPLPMYLLSISHDVSPAD